MTRVFRDRFAGGEGSPQAPRPSEEQVRDALSRWVLPEDAVRRPRHGAVNAVFEVQARGSSAFLRLISASWRSWADVDAELAFVEHLARSGCRVARPVPSRSGALMEEVGGWFATMFEEAPGALIEPGASGWGEAMARAWGETLARQHLAQAGFEPPAATWRRDWRAEPVLVQGIEALHRTDPAAHEAAWRVLAAVEDYAEALGLVGVIHADLAPQNFRWSLSGGVAAFDFDNVCRHWLLYDFAVARSVLTRFDGAERLMSWIRAGYEAVAPLPGDLGLLDVLVRLRLLYVLCDRLWMAETYSLDGQGDALHQLRERLLWTADTSEQDH